MRNSMLTLALATLSLAGCAFGPNLAERMSMYVGQPESVLVAQLGVPNRKMTVDGVTYFAYVRHHVSYSPGSFCYGPAYYSYYGPVIPCNNFPPTYRYERCTVTFALEKKRVQSFTLRGDDCD